MAFCIGDGPERCGIVMNSSGRAGAPVAPGQILVSPMLGEKATGLLYCAMPDCRKWRPAAEFGVGRGTEASKRFCLAHTARAAEKAAMTFCPTTEAMQFMWQRLSESQQQLCQTAVARYHTSGMERVMGYIDATLEAEQLVERARETTEERKNRELYERRDKLRSRCLVALTQLAYIERNTEKRHTNFTEQTLNSWLQDRAAAARLTREADSNDFVTATVDVLISLVRGLENIRTAKGPFTVQAGAIADHNYGHQVIRAQLQAKHIGVDEQERRVAVVERVLATLAEAVKGEIRKYAMAKDRQGHGYWAANKFPAVSPGDLSAENSAHACVRTGSS